MFLKTFPVEKLAIKTPVDLVVQILEISSDQAHITFNQHFAGIDLDSHGISRVNSRGLTSKPNAQKGGKQKQTCRKRLPSGGSYH